MELKLSVAAGTCDRDLCPVRVPLPELGEGTGARLYETETGAEVPCQAVPGELAFLLLGLPRGEVRRYRLVLGGAPAPPAPGFGVKAVGGDALEVTVGGQLFTRYNYGPSWHRPFFHPVIGPGGKRVTRSWPMEEGVEGPDESKDHPHHTGLYVAHGEVNDVNHWGRGERAGRMVHRELGALASGPVYAEVQERLDWVRPTGEPMLAERRTFAVYDLPGEERLLDLTIALEARHGPVHFGDTKEAGLLSVRVASSMEGKRGAGLIENAFGGRREGETWGRAAPWCHYSGPVDDVIEGIGAFDHPGNPRYPTAWHVRDYGLFSANPFGYHDYFPGTTRDGSLTVPAGQTITFRFRVHFHRGDAAAGKTAERWSDFALPPAVGVDE
jgi:Family of unknown function (DUF6807)